MNEIEILVDDFLNGQSHVSTLQGPFKKALEDGLSVTPKDKKIEYLNQVETTLNEVYKSHTDSCEIDGCSFDDKLEVGLNVIQVLKEIIG